LNKQHRDYERVHGVIEQCLAREERVLSFHDLRLETCRGELHAAFDVTVHEVVGRDEYEVLGEELQKGLAKEVDGVRFTIKAEPHYGYRG
jgi:divalent metal cation (Fe/Co/Zn/Cd) transporter